jgi:serine/threonine-protein kinase
MKHIDLVAGTLGYSTKKNLGLIRNNDWVYFTLMKKNIILLAISSLLMIVFPGCDYINETMVETPKLINMSLEAAKILSQERGLELVITDKLASDIVAKDSIISQEPSPNTLIKMSREVFVTISSGKKNVILPNYTGKKFGQVQLDVLEKGLSFGSVEEVYAKSSDAGVVIDQFPAPGSTVDQNTPIMLTVSLGYMIKMPDVIGMDYQEATSKIIEEGFSVEKITTKELRAKFSPINSVVRQDPEPGLMIDPKCPIFIYYNPK